MQRDSFSRNLQVLRLPSGGAPEVNTTFLSVGATGSCALPDEVAFKLSYPSKNGHAHFAGVCGGIRPRLRDGLEADVGVADHFRDRCSSVRNPTDTDVPPLLHAPAKTQSADVRVTSSTMCDRLTFLSYGITFAIGLGLKAINLGFLINPII